jgi:hypothetical protein
MYLNNKIINLSNSIINSYNITTDKSVDKSVIKNFIISFIKECNRKNIYPSSLDIINLIDSNTIINISNLKNYIKKNIKTLQKNYLPKNTDEVCLVTCIYNDLNNEWYEYISEIFDKIYIINYSDKNYHIKNCKILKSTNYNSIELDILLLCNDLKYNYNKIIILEEYQRIGIIISDVISYNTDIIKQYILDINNRYNYELKKLIKINHKTYNLNEKLFIFKSNINYIIYDNSDSIAKYNKTYKSALIITNHIFECKCSQKNIYYKYKNNPEFKINDQITTLEEYIFNYYENDILSIKLKIGEVEGFFVDNYKISEYISEAYYFKQKHNSLITYNPYDYQFLNESLIIKFSNNIINDFILLLYFCYIAKTYNKKLFIRWNHHININTFIKDEFYFINECKDNIKKYEISRFINFDSNILLDNITYINTQKLNIDKIENKQFIQNILDLDWIDEIHNLIVKINKIYNNDTFLIDLDDDNSKLIEKIIQLESDDIFIINQYNDIISHQCKDIIYIYICVKTNHIIYDSFKYYYKFLISNLIDFNKLLHNSQILYKENDEILFRNIDFGISFDNLLITYINDNEYLEYINDSKFLSRANIIANMHSWDSYKLIFITNLTSLGKCLNTIINKSKEKYTIISLNKKIVSKFFYYNIITENEYYYDNNIFYFSKNIFENINGFNENLDDESIYLDFCERAKYHNFKNIYKFCYKYELLSFWGKENIMQGDYSKIKKNCYLIK